MSNTDEYKNLHDHFNNTYLTAVKKGSNPLLGGGSGTRTMLRYTG